MTEQHEIEQSEDRKWIKIGPYLVAIVKTDEGIAVDIYQDSLEMEEAVSSCWALDADLDLDDWPYIEDQRAV